MHSVLSSQRHDGNNGDGAIGDSSPSSNSQRLCVVCEREIPPARLKAMPTASKCVQCVMDSGDVPRLRRHDQLIGTLETGDVVSTYYKEPNQYLARAIAEQNKLKRRGPANERPRYNPPGPGLALRSFQIDVDLAQEMKSSSIN